MQHYVRNFGIGGSVAFFLVKITPPYYTVRPQPQLPYHDHKDVDHYHHQNFHHINNHRAQPQPPTMPYHSQPTPTITTMMTTMTTTTNNTMRTTKFSDKSLTNTLDQCFYLYSTTIVTSITVLSERRFLCWTNEDQHSVSRDFWAPAFFNNSVPSGQLICQQKDIRIIYICMYSTWMVVYVTTWYDRCIHFSTYLHIYRVRAVLTPKLTLIFSH